MPNSEFSIDTFRTNFQTGARSYMFVYEPQWPTVIPATYPMSVTNAKYLVRSSSLPSSSFDELLVSWQGFDFKQAGKRMYNDFTVSFNVDLKAGIRKNFLAWQDLILDPKTNAHAMPDQYFRDQTITLLGLDFDVNGILTYDFKYAWPKDVGDLTLDYTNSEMAMFDVTFAFTYFTWR